MKKITALLILTIALSTLNKADCQIYTSGWDTPAEQSGWAEWELGTTSANDWEVIPNTPVSSPNSLIHYYPVGGTSITDDWYVSPLFNFENGGSLDSLSYKFGGFGTPMTGDTVAIYLITGSDNPALATSKSLLKIFNGADYQNDNTWRKLSSINIPPTVGNSYLAFRYKTIINWLDVQYDNLGITANFSTSTKNLSALNNAITLYPNPTAGQFQLKMPQNITAYKTSIYSATGILILQSQNTDIIDLSRVSNGYYHVSIETDLGTISKKLIKQ